MGQGSGGKEAAETGSYDDHAWSVLLVHGLTKMLYLIRFRKTSSGLGKFCHVEDGPSACALK
jgi:hypothetical protein